jgi:hypothetical protein
MRMRTIAIITLILLTGFISACKKDYYEITPAPNLAIPVSFNTEVLPIFKNNCYGSGCHNTGVAPDLSAANAYDVLTLGNYVDSTNAETSTLYMRLTSSSKPMPPSGKMSGENINKILAWMKQGYKNN